uniref:Uncharacterized protein n=1 Tax=Anguilla anguilla TaxID=7936 RepID=A0A0E9PBW6_ANGAN
MHSSLGEKETDGLQTGNKPSLRTP